MGQLKADKGRDVNRTLVLAGIVYLCIGLNTLDRRVAVIEAAHAPRPVHVASAETNHLAGFETR